MWIWIAAARAGSPIVAEQPGGPNLAVEIELQCGALVIRGSDRQTVKVGGSVEDPDALHVSSNPGRVSIEVDAKHSAPSCGDLLVEVPAHTAIEVELVSASVRIEGVTGPLDVETLSGAIAVSGTPSRLNASTMSGEVRVTADVRRLQIETVSGAMGLSGVGGTLELSSVSGEIRVEAASPLEAVAAATVSGPISVAGALAPQGRIDLESHAGPLTVGLPGTTNAIVSWSTFAGKVSNRFGGVPEGQPVRLGTGDGRVELETFAGAIDITRRD